MYHDMIERLKKHNLTEYEAKAYLSLLTLGKSSAREVGEKSGVPQGRIYTVLNNLETQGFVTVQAGSPAYYAAQDPKEVFASIRESYCNSIDDLIRDLMQFKTESSLYTPFWTIHSERGIQIMAKNIIRDAEKEIIIVTNEPEPLKQLKNSLLAVKKKVDISILVFDKGKFTGLGLKTRQMSKELAKFFEEMHSGYNEMKYDRVEEEFFLLIDGKKAFSIGFIHGKKCGNVINVSTLCYMTRRLIGIYEPGIGISEF